ncbi:hypothetical protein QOT17_018637 [Balamuthia mandrillaris]
MKKSYTYCKVGTGLFASWYFGEEALEVVLEKIKTCQAAQPQSRFSLGLVQATMMGKTRLILQLSKRTPLILIRLDKTNAAYRSLRRFISDEAQKIKVETQFEDWQLCNRNIFNHIRLFFLSYLIYAKEWKNTIQDKLFGQDLTNIADEIDLFNASLLNGGQMYVDWVFQREVESICEGDPKIISRSILEHHRELSGYLNAPTFAIDECHMLASGYDTRGLLFHSDYEDYPPQKVLEWQRHERFEVPSDSYPNKQSTTLFSGFQWVLEEYLFQGEPYQTSVFASTFLSVWDPCLNSRDKPYIERIILKQLFELSQVLQGLQQSSDQLDNPEIKNILMQWCGRPGFFFDFFLPIQQSLSLSAKISKTHQQAESDLFESVLNNALESLKSKDLKMDLLDLPVYSKELHHFLIFSSRLCGSNISRPSSGLFELVAAGFVLVKEYQSQGKSIGIIHEPLVKSFLLQRAQLNDAHSVCDEFIVQRLRRAHGSSFGHKVWYAVANQILLYCQSPLKQLLMDWGCDWEGISEDMTSIIDGLDIDSMDLFTNKSLVRVTRPCDGIMLPDTLFFASDEHRLCLVSVQIKCMSSNLSNEEFDGAISSMKLFSLTYILLQALTSFSPQSPISQQCRRESILLAVPDMRKAIFGSHCASVLD